jgi:hypothetical protein
MKRLADPEYRAFLVGLYRLALADDSPDIESVRSGTTFSRAF